VRTKLDIYVRVHHFNHILTMSVHVYWWWL